jgi:FO synthase
MALVSSGVKPLLRAVEAGRRLDTGEALEVLAGAPSTELFAVAESLTRAGFGETVTYSRKVFIPLTQLCRDVCHYCTFAKAPRHLKSVYLAAEEVLAIAHAGAAADCKEALFTLGDKPEVRYSVARAALDDLGAHGQTRADGNRAAAPPESRGDGRGGFA